MRNFKKISSYLLTSLLLIFFQLFCVNPAAPKNNPPQIFLTADTTVGLFDTLNISVSIKDDDKAFLFYWKIDTFLHKDTLDSSIRISFQDTGIHIISVTLIDSRGKQSRTDSLRIHCFSFEPNIFLNANSIAAVYDTIRINGHAWDRDGYAKEYLWSVNNLQFDTTSDSTRFFIFDTLFIGINSIYAKVIDDDNLVSATDSIHISIHKYAPIIVVKCDTDISILDTIIISATGTDTNGTIKEYHWSQDGTNWNTTLLPFYNLFYSIKEVGFDTIFTYCVDNNKLKSRTDSLLLKIHMYAPIISRLKDTNVAINDTFTIHVLAADTNGTIEKYLWSLDQIYWDTTTINSNKYSFDKSDTGKQTIYVRVIDNDNLPSVVDSFIVHVHLFAPNVESMSDTTVAVYDSVSIHAASLDTNGIVMKYIWSVHKGEFDTTYSPVHKILYTASDTGKQTIQVRCIDDDDISSKEDSSFIQVHLYQPSIKIQPFDSVISALDSVRIVATAFDTNGTIKKYCWSSDGATFDTTNDSTLVVYYRNSGIYQLYVKVFDDDTLSSPTDSIKFRVIWDTTADVKSLQIRNDSIIKRSIVNEGNLFRLCQFFTKCNLKVPIKIGFIGGSITAGAMASSQDNCYANKLTHFLSQLYPQTNFSLINAGIGATDSRYGCSRVSSDIFQYNPDLIVIEFAVNDDAADTVRALETMEGLVRQCLAKPGVAVMMLLTFNVTGDSTMQRIHTKIAKYYGIPAISYRESCWPLIENGSFEFSDISADWVHPNDLGHLTCSYILYNFIKCKYKDFQLNKIPIPLDIVKPMLPLKTDLFEFADIMNSTNSTIKIDSTCNWIIKNDQFKRNSFTSDSIGDSITLITNAREITIAYRARNDLWSTTDVFLDGDFVETLENYYSNDWGGGYMKLFKVYEDATSREHKIVLTHSSPYHFLIEGILFAK